MMRLDAVHHRRRRSIHRPRFRFDRLLSQTQSSCSPSLSAWRPIVLLDTLPEVITLTNYVVAPLLLLSPSRNETER